MPTAGNSIHPLGDGIQIGECLFEIGCVARLARARIVAFHRLNGFPLPVEFEPNAGDAPKPRRRIKGRNQALRFSKLVEGIRDGRIDLQLPILSAMVVRERETKAEQYLIRS